MRFLDIVRRVRAISTPLGGISWAGSTASQVPKFEDAICLTWDNNDEFFEFLMKSDGKVVGLSARLDASVSVERQNKFVEASSEAFKKIHNCEVSGVVVPLPNTKMLAYLTFYLLGSRRLRPSHGGTGIFMMPLKGLFEVSRTAHGGPSVHFHLTELEAPLEFRVSVFGG